MPRRPKPRPTPKSRTHTTKPRKPPQRRAMPTALVPTTRDKTASGGMSVARRSTGELSSSNKPRNRFCSVDDQTPVSLCSHIVGLFEWGAGEVVLEPARGDGGFYNALPACVVREYCEYREGLDFFDYVGEVDTVITNPPFKERGQNLVIPFLDKSLGVARKRVIFLINHNAFLSLTPVRLRGWGELGWGVTMLTVFSIKKWFGRYYLVVFERTGSSLLGFDCRSWV